MKLNFVFSRYIEVMNITGSVWLSLALNEPIAFII